ncbi:MAG TPA: amino acid adenylation domain-containing protein [Pyrinomonadaceae bacterium]|nr:amino acid adenylation domain-containing protein [Pyrinomonadaceae bacterium]
MSTREQARRRELLAQLLSEELAGVPQAQTIRPRRDDGPAPLSYSQQRLWFLHQLDPESPAYNLSMAVRCEAGLDVAALERSLGEIVRRHEILRTRFVTVEGQPAQVIAPAEGFELSRTDLRSLPESEREAELERLVTAETRRPFDLARGPLVRGGLVRLGEDDYVALICLHHIVSDGWSTGVLVRELTELYGAFSAGLTPALAPLPIQYADFASWQREWLSGEVLESELAYWRQRLEGRPALLALPTDRPRPAVQTSRGATRSMTLSGEVTRGLRELCRREGATLFMTLLAALKVQLSRYAGQEDVVVGTPIANRNRPEVEGLIGFFVNTLVLRTDLSGSPTFLELLGRVRSDTLEAYAHQDLPFEKLVEALQPERDLSQTPLFQVCFVLQNAPTGEGELTGLRMKPVGVDSGTAKFDLTLLVEERPEGLTCTLEYNVDLFDASTAERILKHYRRLLESITADPSQHIDALPLVGDEERRQLLAWNDTAARPAPELCLHEEFERQAALRPDRVAVSCGDLKLTYSELNSRADSLASELRRRGVGPDVVVGLLAERSAELVVGLLGILKAGGAYLPLEPSLPEARLRLMAEDAGARVVVAGQHALVGLAEAVAGPGGEVLCVEDGAWGEAAAPSRAARPDNLAYVIYTSGSTGTPKGTLISHANVMRLFSSTQHWFGFNERDVWTLFHSYAFDFSVWEIWGALLYGGRLVVVPEMVSRSPEAFYELVCAEGVSVLNQTPSAFRQFIHAERSAPEHLRHSLRTVIFGGEALELRSLNSWYERHADDRPRLVNMYGITETTVHVTYQPLTAGLAAGAAGSLVGRPIPDLQVYVLDRQLRPAPVGVPGEMYVGGAGLSRGYLRRPGLCAQKFVPHPFSAEPGARLYKTGDLARHLADGSLEFLGRGDEQVKVRGFRIELGEIEGALTEHPAVRECVVTARDGDGGGKRLAAYVVLKPGAEATTFELREHLARRLPAYMVPAAFVFLDELPLTRNKKVDRRALPAPGTARPDLAEAYAAPSNEAEEVLAAIWSRVLGVERVGVHDNFFALGGDSIRSVQVIAQAKERGLNLSLPQLFRRQTVGELALALKADGSPAAPGVRSEPFGLISADDRAKLPRDLDDAYPLTMLQSGMLFHMELEPDVAAYHNVHSLFLRVRFSAEAFRAAVRRVVARHPVLRTSFDLANYGEPLQLVHKSAVLPVEVEDIGGLTAGEQEQAVAAYLESEVGRPFDLARAPLLRFRIHLCGEEAFYFTFTECHAIFDGWSLHATLNEIFTLYFALLNGEPAPEPAPLSATFRDFVLRERAALESEECRSFWAKKLADCPALELPRRVGARPEGDGGRRIRIRELSIPREVAEGLRRLARTAAVPVKSVLMAAHLKVMSVLGGQDDVVTGFTTHNRPEERDGEQVRGLFLNTLPFRLRLTDGTWLELVRRTFEAERELLPFRCYPATELQKSRPQQPLFETYFNFVHFHVIADTLRSGSVSVSEFKKVEESNFKLVAGFSLNLLTEEMALELDYDSAVLGEEQMEAVSGYYLSALSAMAAEPLSLHQTRCLLSDVERHRLLVEFNSTAAQHPSDLRLHEMIQEQAARTPGRVAVSCGARHLTYAELDARSSDLARALRRRGVGQGSVVALLAERSVEMVVAALGVLKSGAAYLPLDPAAPPARLAEMAARAGARVAVTGTPEEASAARQLGLDAMQACGPEAREGGEDVAATWGRPHAEDLAYVIYTSGSTGTPKGVQISHGALSNFIHFMGRQLWLSGDDVLLAVTTLCFDIAVLELFLPLTVGARAIIADRAAAADGARLGELLAESDITLMQATPATWRLLLEGGWRGNSGLKMLCGGEALPRELADELLARGSSLWNMFGPTETTIWSSVCEVTPGGGAVSLGRPIDNTQFYVLDRRLRPVPTGVAGELYIGGAGLSAGYLRDPGLTARAFVPDPFAGEPGARLYKTGDLVRYSGGGVLEFVGRVDHQVKIRGYRIEPGEIEARLREHPAVGDAAVKAFDASPADRRLAAYVVAHPGHEVTAVELRDFAGERLPDYMVPSAFVLLEKLPLTPSGKVDRRALPEPLGALLGTGREYVGPRNDTERAVALVWQEALGVGRVGVFDNFFELGGHSLVATRIVHSLQRLFDIKLPLQSLFHDPTVAGLSSSLEDALLAELESLSGETTAELLQELS